MKKVKAVARELPLLAVAVAVVQELPLLAVVIIRYSSRDFISPRAQDYVQLIARGSTASAGGHGVHTMPM